MNRCASCHQLMIGHPNWVDVMAGCSDPSQAGQARLLRDNDLLLVTRGSLKLARSALREVNTRDYYHNSGEAEQEISHALGGEKA